MAIATQHQRSFSTGLFHWWWTGLMAWLPKREQSDTRLRRHIRLRLQGEQIVLSIVEKSGLLKQTREFDISHSESSLTEINNWLRSQSKLPLVLCLPAGQGLKRVLQLPAAASDEIVRILPYEIEQQTPFKADQVYYGYRSMDSNHPAKLSLELTVIPKKTVAAIVQQLPLGNHHLSAVQLWDDLEQKPQIELPLPDREKPQKQNSGRLNFWLGLLAVTLLLCLLYQPVISLENATQGLQERIQSAKKRAMVTNELRQRNQSRAWRARFLDSKFSEHRIRLDILEELARILPDATWISRCHIQDDRLSLKGESASASELISLLTETGHFEDVRFNSAITRDEKSGKERFSLVARLSPERSLDDV